MTVEKCSVTKVTHVYSKYVENMDGLVTEDSQSPILNVSVEGIDVEFAKFGNAKIQCLRLTGCDGCNHSYTIPALTGVVSRDVLPGTYATFLAHSIEGVQAGDGVSAKITHL